MPVQPSQNPSFHPCLPIIALYKCLSNLMLVLPSVPCLVICLNEHHCQRNKIHLMLCLHQVHSLWPVLPILGQHSYPNGEAPDLIQVQAMPSRKKRASFYKDWFPTLGTMISHKQLSRYTYGTDAHHFHLCTFHVAQGTLVFFG